MHQGIKTHCKHFMVSQIVFSIFFGINKNDQRKIDTLSTQ